MLSMVILGACGQSGIAGLAAGRRHRRLFQRPGDFLRTMVHRGVSVVRKRNIVPFLRRELAPGLHHLLAPDAGPGQAGDKEEHQEQRDPEADHPVKRTPHRPAAAANRGDQGRAPARIARPPHVKPCGDQHHAEGCCDLDHPVTGDTEQEVAVNVVEEVIPAAAAGKLRQNGGCVGIDGDHGRLAVKIDAEDGGEICGAGGHILPERAAGNGGQCGIGLGRDGLGNRLRLNRDAFAVAAVDISDPGHGHAGDGQHGEEGNDIEPGIEMPAPCRKIEFIGACMHGGLRRRTGGIDRDHQSLL
jgi:hypothetical protein